MVVTRLFLCIVALVAACAAEEEVINSVDFAMPVDYHTAPVPLHTQKRWLSGFPQKDKRNAEIFQDHAEHHQAQTSELQRSWKFDYKLLCASSGVHGLLNKTALGSSEPWLQLGYKYKSMFKHAGIPLYSGLMIYVSYKYKFIYLRQQKSSSTSIIQALKDAFCEHDRCEPDVLSLFVSRTPHDYEWANFFVFTWVRNPWTRMASSYTMLSNDFMRVHTLGQEGPGEPCTIPFEEFTKNSYELVSACEKKGCCLWDPYRHKWAYDYIPGHLNDQSHAIFLPDGSSMVDFVGRTEHMKEDWNQLLGIIEARSGTTLKRVAVEKINPSVDDSSSQEDDYVPCLGKRAGKLNEATMLNIAKQYAADVQMLGFHV